MLGVAQPLASEREATAYDQRGRRYEASRIKVANIESRGSVFIRLVAEVPTAILISFEGLPSGVEIVKLLDLKLFTNGWSYGKAELRNIEVAQ